MTLKEFAVLAGVTVERCDKGWGGTWAYRTADGPCGAFAGYRTEVAAYKAWAEKTFGKTTFKALSKVLENQR